MVHFDKWESNSNEFGLWSHNIFIELLINLILNAKVNVEWSNVQMSSVAFDNKMSP